MALSQFIAAVHMRPYGSISIGIAILLWTLWYWLRLGRPDVPVSRRRIRRLSMTIMLLSLPIFVTALSFIDPDVEQIRYVRTWTVAIGMIGLVILSALVDALNNWRLHARQKHSELRESAIALARELAKRRNDRSQKG